MSGEDEKNRSPAGTEALVMRKSLIEFPACFPIKVIGRNQDAFQKAVERIVAARIACKDVIDIAERPSKNVRFLSITITARFSDKAAIDKVYEAFTREPEVMMAL